MNRENQCGCFNLEESCIQQIMGYRQVELLLCLYAADQHTTVWSDARAVAERFHVYIYSLTCL